MRRAQTLNCFREHGCENVSTLWLSSKNIKKQRDDLLNALACAKSCTKRLHGILNSDPNASIKVSVEISADFPDGATDQVKRAVSENAKSLNFGSAEWE